MNCGLWLQVGLTLASPAPCLPQPPSRPFRLALFPPTPLSGKKKGKPNLRRARWKKYPAPSRLAQCARPEPCPDPDLASAWQPVHGRAGRGDAGARAAAQACVLPCLKASQQLWTGMRRPFLINKNTDPGLISHAPQHPTPSRQRLHSAWRGQTPPGRRRTRRRSRPHARKRCSKCWTWLSPGGRAPSSGTQPARAGGGWEWGLSGGLCWRRRLGRPACWFGHVSNKHAAGAGRASGTRTGFCIWSHTLRACFGGMPGPVRTRIHPPSYDPMPAPAWENSMLSSLKSMAPFHSNRMPRSLKKASLLDSVGAIAGSTLLSRSRRGDRAGTKPMTPVGCADEPPAVPWNPACELEAIDHEGNARWRSGEAWSFPSSPQRTWGHPQVARAWGPLETLTPANHFPGS